MFRTYVGLSAIIITMGSITACRSSANAGGAPTKKIPGSVTLIIDRTVSDSDALIEETQQALDEITKEMATNGPSYFGGRIKLVYADDAGEHSAAWKVEVPESFGVKKSLLKKAIAAVNERKLETLKALRDDRKVYQKSYLVESANRELELLKEDGKLIIISDMCVVDRSGNNFERLVFAAPPSLPIIGEVAIRRIGRKGQSLEEIKLIDSWWNDALFGRHTFGTIYESYLNRKKFRNTSAEKTTDKPNNKSQRFSASNT